MLLEHGANINCFDRLREPVYYAAIERGDVSIINLLLKYGTSPIALLTKAINSACIGVVKQLLEHGVNPTIANEEGDIPFILAARNGQKNIVGLFLINGVNPNTVKQNGRTVFM